MAQKKDNNNNFFRWTNLNKADINTDIVLRSDKKIATQICSYFYFKPSAQKTQIKTP